MRQFSFIFLAVWYTSLVNALIWEGPKATDTPTRLVASTFVRQTAEPAASLAKRDAVLPQTCGYIQGNQSLAVTCSSSSSCVWHTDFKVVGCCKIGETKTPCAFYTECADEHTNTTVPDIPLWYTCKGTSTCFANSYDSGYFQYGCGFPAATVHLTYSNQVPDAATVHQAFIGTKELDAAATQTVVSTIIISSTTAAGQSSEHGISGGGVAGIAIGSLVFGAIVAAGLLLYLIRRKKNKAAENPQSHQSMGHANHEQYPSTFASPQTQFSTPVSPHTYLASPPPPEASFHQPQPYPHTQSSGMHQQGELVANPPKEMDASPVVQID